MLTATPFAVDTVASAEPTLDLGGAVHTVGLADGRLVRLAGALTGEVLPQLRLALLAPLPADCRDVVVDAGEVTELDDEAIAVLLAALPWTEAAGARLLVSRSSAEFDATLVALGLFGEFPRLTPRPCE
jgi:anti-anti-sigma regulatory factor